MIMSADTGSEHCGVSGTVENTSQLGPIIVTILQMGKLKHKEVKLSFQGQQLAGSRIKIGTQDSRVQALDFYVSKVTKIIAVTHLFRL